MDDLGEWLAEAYEQHGNLGIWAVVAVVVAIIVLLAVRELGGPRPGEFWMADVPFRSGDGSKDRPCYVVGRAGPHVRVLYVTSQDRSNDDRYVRVDTSGWSGGVRGRTSWMQVAERRGVDPCLIVRRRAFRRRLARASRAERRVVASAL